MSPIRDRSARKRVGPMVEEEVAPDLSQFEKDKNIVVKAAAGTGKTTALIGRMVALVREGMSPEDMVAITFTREASSEMRARFKDGLRKTIAALDGSESRLKSALQKANECFIDTIHAFCTQILREYAEQAGLPPGFSVVEPEEEGPLKRQIWNEHLEETTESLHAEALSEVGIEVADLYNFYSDWCGFCDLPLASSAPSRLQVPDLEPAMEEVRSFIDTWAPIAPFSDPDALTELFEKERRLQAQGALEDHIVKHNLLSDFDDVAQDRSVKHTKWEDTSRSDQLRQEGGPLDELHESLRPTLRAWKEYVHAHASAFVEEAVRDRYYRAGYDYGTLTFQHLLLYTRDLLQKSPRVREQLQKRYETVLVDEFQDTDPVQAEILFYLTGRHTEEEDWWRCEPEPGRLFVVGDGKQSIYRFRRADHRIFEEVETLIGNQSGGQTETFRTNFRSTTEVCTVVNASFRNVMVGEGPRVGYEDLEAEKDSFDGDVGLSEMPIGSVSGNYASSIAEKEGKRVAKFITSVCGENVEGTPVADVFEGGGPSYGDVLLLARTAKRFPQYAHHLSKADVPFTIAGGKSLEGDVGARALVDLLTVATRPGDGEARAAYLSGLLVGLSDRELYQVRYGLTTSSGERVNLNSSYRTDALRQGDAPEQVFQSVKDAYSLEGETRRRLEKEPVSAVVDWLVEDQGLMAHAALDQKGDLEAGALLRLQNEIKKMESQDKHAWDVVEQLRSIVQGDRDVSTMTHREGQEDVVRLMTVHQAKGLEAPIVFLLDPYDRDGSIEGTSHVSRPDKPGAKDPKLHLPVREPNGPYNSDQVGQPHGWKSLEETEIRYQKAEEERIAYVAATRAERLLVVSRYHKDGDPKENPEKTPWWPLYSTLDEREAPHLEDLCEFSPAGSTDSREKPAVLPSPPDGETFKELQTPTYQTASVTEQVKAPYEPLADGSGHSPEDPEAFGSAVHDLLEWAVYNRETLPAPSDREAIARRALKEQYPGFGKQDLKRAVTMLEEFRSSSIWKDLRHARATYPEHSLTWRENGTVVRGTIDLIYATPDSWHIVDYKTDQIGKNGVPNSIGEHKYSGQVRRYADAWERITGKEVASASLWFADAGEIISIR